MHLLIQLTAADSVQDECLRSRGHVSQVQYRQHNYSVSLGLSVPEACSEVVATRHKRWSHRRVDDAPHDAIVTCSTQIMSLVTSSLVMLSMLKLNLQEEFDKLH